MNRALQAGFTLVETLVALTLLGITLALLFDGLYVMGRSARAGHVQLFQNDRARVVRAFLRRKIGEAVPLSAGHGAELNLLFEGAATELRFFGELPAHRGGGGVYEMRLKREDDETGAHLALSYRNAWPDRLMAPAGSAGWTTTHLADNVDSVTFAYFGPASDDTPDAPRRWHANWAERPTLPRWVKVTMSFDDGSQWPEQVIRIRTRSPGAQVHFISLPASTGPAS